MFDLERELAEALNERARLLEQALADAREMLWPDMVEVTGPKNQADLWKRIAALIGPPYEKREPDPERVHERRRRSR